MTPALLRSQLALPQLFGTGVPAADAAGTAGITLNLGAPGSCPRNPTLFIAMFDDSASMLGGADSTGLRYAEAAVAFETVTRRCSCDRELAAILHMNRPNSADRAAAPLSRRAKSDFAGGLVVPADGDGASAMAATLRRAHRIAANHPDHQTVLAAFSDFELVDDMTVLAEDLAKFPGDVHAVVMRSLPPDELYRDGLTVTHVAGGEPVGAVGRALFDALTVHRPGRRAAQRKAI